MAEQLASLDAVKVWAKVGTGQTAAAPNDDALMTRLIASASAMILQFTNRKSFGAKVFTESYESTGGGFIMLRQFPIISVSSVGIGGSAYSASTGPTVSGYRADIEQGAPGLLRMVGGAFPRGVPIDVTYTAGYMVADEAQVVDATSHTVTPHGLFLGDMGIAYAISGLALVATTGVPGPGQYRLTPTGYLFNADDAGAHVLISYSTVPEDVQQACVETVVERLRSRERVGEASRSQQNGTSVTYGTWDLNAFVRSALMRYINVIPC